jgi:hypothetical protein
VDNPNLIELANLVSQTDRCTAWTTIATQRSDPSRDSGIKCKDGRLITGELIIHLPSQMAAPE